MVLCLEPVIGIRLIRLGLVTLDRSKEPEPKMAINKKLHLDVTSSRLVRRERRFYLRLVRPNQLLQTSEGTTFASFFFRLGFYDAWKSWETHGTEFQCLPDLVGGDRKRKQQGKLWYFQIQCSTLLFKYCLSFIHLCSCIYSSFHPIIQIIHSSGIRPFIHQSVTVLVCPSIQFQDIFPTNHPSIHPNLGDLGQRLTIILVITYSNNYSDDQSDKRKLADSAEFSFIKYNIRNTLTDENEQIITFIFK